MNILGVIFLFFVMFPHRHLSSDALLTNSKEHFNPDSGLLKFCSHNGTGSACSGSTKDVQLSAGLLQRESLPSNASVLCISTSLLNSSQSQDDTSAELCAKLGDECGGRTLYDAKLQFNGKPGPYHSIKAQNSAGLCLEKIGNGAYIDFVPHPDGSNRVFLSKQQGRIWLATIPDEGSNGILGIVESKPFLDLTHQVAFDSGHGLMGMAFHTNFLENGRFFLSFNCDKLKQPGCSGRCACNSDVGCDPAKLGNDNGVSPCQYHTVVAEFSINDTTKSNPSLAKSANSAEVRRILTIGLPQSGGHAGQILFGPADGYLYIMTADGSHRDDPHNFAQNKKSLLGKILRIDIDNLPSGREISELGLWGNYSIPKDNPFQVDKELEPEIWALGFKNPWRCSFHAERPSFLLCGDAGQDRYEEINLVVKGGNYGWRVYEGPLLFHPGKSPGGNTSRSSINPIFPVMGYYHSDIDKKNLGSASIASGFFYRSMTDPCMYGRFLYSDLYAGDIWAGIENPGNSRNFTTKRIPVRCAHDSSIECSFVAGSSQPELGYVFSFGEDNKKDIYILTSSGVYRVARPSRCNFTCSEEHVSSSEEHVSSQRPHSSSLKLMMVSCRNTGFCIPFLLLFLIIGVL